MTLVKMKEILKHAQEHQYGVGAFSVANMEMVMGAVRAAEELRSPLILQIAEVRLKHSPLHIIGPAMVAAAKAATVPAAVHFDHGLSEERSERHLKLASLLLCMMDPIIHLEKILQRPRKSRLLLVNMGRQLKQKSDRLAAVRMVQWILKC